MSKQSYWETIPRLVRQSWSLTSDEKELYYLIADNLNQGGYCTLSNVEFAEKFKTSTRTISSRLSSMQKKKYISITINTHAHQRRIYLKLPGEPTTEPEPTEEQLEPKTKCFQESLKKAIVFGTIDFNTLIEKLYESPYLENVEDNSIQFALNSNQIKFLADFQKFLPHKKIDCQISAFPPMDYSKLLEAIRNSKFLYESSNLNLKWFLQNSEKIINGDYEQFIDLHETPYKSNYKSRDYEPNELNSPFTIDPDQIDIGDNDTNHEIESKPFVEQKKGKKPKIFSHQELNKIFKHL